MLPYFRMTLHFPALIFPSESLSTPSLVAFIILGISIIIFTFFWIWSLIHAYRTPRAPFSQRLFWSLCILINPTATVWYWCVWQRWAFWTLFTPLIGIFIALPFAIRSLMSKADATMLTNTLFALGSNALIVFFAVMLIFPIILRFVTILHLTKNKEIPAIEKNDWVVTLALPCIGYGTTLFYTTRHLRSWAFTSIMWLVFFTIISKIMFMNILPDLALSGEERREEYKTTKTTEQLN